MIHAILDDLRQQYVTLGRDLEAHVQWERNVGFWLIRVTDRDDFETWIVRFANTMHAHRPLVAWEFCADYIDRIAEVALLTDEKKVQP